MLTIDNAAVAAYPDAKMGLLIVKNVAQPEPSETAEALDAIRRRYGRLDRAGLKALYPIREYVAYYKRFGYSYHVLAQLESVLNGKKQLRAESGLLTAMFLSELESMLLTAGHDLSALRPPLRLTIADEGETYLSISEKEVATVRGDLMIRDGGGILSSILRGPDLRSRITPSTTDALFTVYVPPGVATGDIEDGLRNLERRIKRFSPASETVLLHVYDKQG